MSGPRLLVVDDEPEVLRTLRLVLSGNGYHVVTADSGEAALSELAHRLPDLILLDLMLPGIDGLDVLRAVRERSATLPVIVLSARGEELTKVQALDLGADDYVAKPFGVKELLARIRVALRHAVGSATAPVFEAGGLRIDFDRRSVVTDAGDEMLTAKEAAVLRMLVRHAGRILTHRAVLREVWGPEYESETQYLRNVVLSLRKKLEADPTRPRLLLTEPGAGYRFQPFDA
jgi:two-component system, OmpR family, KDP operon response regulator KdpE